MTLRWCRATDCKFQLPDHKETGRIRSNRTTLARHWATDCISQVSRRRETGRIRAQSGFTLFEEGLSGEHPDSHNVVVEQTVVDPKERPSSDVRVSSEEKSNDLPFIAVRSKRPNTSKPIEAGKFFHFPNDPNCEVCNLAKTSRAPCRNRPMHEETVFGYRKKMVMH